MKKLFFISAFITFGALFFNVEQSFGCHATPIQNITTTTTTTSFILGGSSNASSCGCGNYFMEIEVKCLNEPFNGAVSFSSTIGQKPNCTLVAYPSITVPFANLCPGTQYKWRSREKIEPCCGLGNPTQPLSVWSAQQYFTTSGTAPILTLAVSASPTTVCTPGSSTLTASATGNCGGLTYTWSNGLGTGPTKTVAPTTTTTYTVTLTDNCHGGNTTQSVTVNVGANPVAGTASANPTSVCAGDYSTLTLAGYSGNLQWQTSPNGGAPWTNLPGGTVTPFQLGPITATTFVRAVVESCGNFANSNTLIIILSPPPTITVTNDTVICASDSVVLTASPSSPGGTYLWTPGNFTTSSINVSPSATTTYTVVYSIGSCQSPPVDVTVSISGNPTVTVNDAVICEGDSVLLTAVGSEPGGGFQWSTGQTSASIWVSPTVTTDYTVVFAVGSCVSYPDTATVTVNQSPLVSILDDGVCIGEQGTLTAVPNVSGGTYLWSPGNETTASISDSPSVTSTYTVEYTLNGCSNTASGQIIVSPLPTISISNATICEGDSVTITSTVSEPNGDYIWSTGSANPSILVFPAVTTTYEVMYSVDGCESDTATAIVTVNPRPEISVNNETICYGDTTTLTVVSTLAGGNYIWNPGTYGSVAQVWPDTTTEYSIIHEVNGCLSDSAFSTVTINTIPVINAGPDQSICFGTSAQLTANGATTYEWMPGGQTTQSITVYPPDTAEYIVRGYLNGCSWTDTVVVNVAPVLTLVAASVDANCSNLCDGNLMVIPSGGMSPYTYSWNQGQYTNAYESTACGGSYTIEVTDALGCTADTTVSVFQPTPIYVSTSTTNATCNSYCDGQASVTASGGTPGYSYSWNTVPATAVFGGNVNSVSDLCAGNYRVTITDQNNCSTFANFSITEPDPVVVPTIPNITICIGQTTTLTATAIQGTPGYTFLWGGGETTQSINVSPIITTTYTVVAEDVNNCSSLPQSVTVTVNPPLNVTASGIDSLCLGDNTTLSAVGSGGNGGPYTYTWSSPNVGNFTGASYNVSPFDTTIYTVTVEDFCTSPNASDSHLIKVIPLPLPDFVTDTIENCTPACILFSDNSNPVAGTISSYNWTVGDPGIGVISNASFSHCYTDPGKYDIYLRVTTDKGCINSITRPGYITANPVPVADFSCHPYETSTDDPLITFRDSSIGASKYHWDFGDGTETSNLINPYHMYNDTGGFNITLRVENQFNCVSTTSDYIYIRQALQVYIPNAFAPKGTHNPVFNLKGIGISPVDFEMFIFNRWGGEVFYTTNLEEGWNGYTKSGELSKNDVYVYVIKLKDLAGKKYEYKGRVTLVN
ncbi:MAG: PKD domain-containing protein [Bacteroidota bacterium]|nr:PKD domain-containing protein [Bacteroidota bacterium]